MKSKLFLWIIALSISFHVHAQEAYLDYLSRVGDVVSTSVTELTREVRLLGSGVPSASFDEDFQTLKEKTVLLWVLREAEAMLTEFKTPSRAYALTTHVASPSDVLSIANELTNEAVTRAVDLSVEAANLRFDRKNYTAQLLAGYPAPGASTEELSQIAVTRDNLESEINSLLQREIEIRQSIPVAYVEAALHAAVVELRQADVGVLESAEKAGAAFEFLIFSASAAYADALIFLGKTRMDVDELIRGLDAIDGATGLQFRAIEDATPYL